MEIQKKSQAIKSTHPALIHKKIASVRVSSSNTVVYHHTLAHLDPGYVIYW